MAAKVRRNDTVEITTGKDRGKRGEVRRVLVKEQRLVVSGINLVKRHRRQRNPQEPSAIIEMEAPLHVSNVKVVCPLVLGRRARGLQVPGRRPQGAQLQELQRGDRLMAETETTQTKPIPALKQRYRDEVVPTLTREFGYTNPMQVPTLSKVSLNIGLGEALTNGRAIESAQADLATITGQRPVVNRAKKAISNFKLREGNPIGVSLTLRGDRMWEFVDRLMNVALPRVRDFRGVNGNAFDGRGNYALGLTEQLIFPEISFDQVERVRGMQINIITTAQNDEEGKRLIELLGMPYSRS